MKILFIFLLFLIPLPAFAEDDSVDSAESLGWISIIAGVIGTLPFLFLNKIRRYTISSGNQSLTFFKKIGSSYTPILNFHIMLNSIGYVSGMIHGLILAEHLDSISLSLAITMTVLMISGLLLRYTSSRHTKLFSRLMHGQMGLLILLLVLIFLHLVTAND